MKLKLFVLILSLFAAAYVYAGGPFSVDYLNDTGVALQWKDKNLQWWSDDSNLSDGGIIVDNTKAKQWVSDAMNLWTTAFLHDATRTPVQTVSVAATYKGSIGKDVNGSNFSEYTSSTPGETVIIFDKDGMITKSIAGENYKYIPGLSEILLADSTGTKILKGVVIFNGTLLTDKTLTEAEYKSAILHEVGHLFNLDHTQVNLDIAAGCDLGGTCEGSTYIPTMFPELKTAMQGEALKIDDKVTISWIYPNSTLNSSFCTIKGEIHDRDGRPLQGVNVIARRVGDGDTIMKADSRSMVSGVMYPACYSDGHYYLYGIVPGKTYEVFYEPLSAEYTGMSGFEPLGNPPTDFEKGNIPSADGATTVSCAAGGETIEMQTVQVDVDNPCAPGDGGEVVDTGKSGGCSIITKIKNKR